ncbi:hypothetical protein DAPPUDRAFT_304825 [Daphnia pulex]|uniref:Uncharacterized protein n=1 Tax=Daphnia pulex TaxID=6669 RepID=E9GM65_DAPPU|nr:hypothetical protein DAPPUDRAFT_304825 [Daphnia pulex]|eukprot:EFX79307.1 hypothetical protein DAPPUDRAFT_304825 [Daphnia pulex]
MMTYLRVGCEIPRFYSMSAEFNHLNVFHSCYNVIVMCNKTARLTWPWCRRCRGGRWGRRVSISYLTN